MSHPDPEQSLKERMYYFERQHVVIEEFDSSGYILDIGGGGEGIIGRLKPQVDGLSPVVAIDPIRRELEDAPPGPLKVVMDARSLDFLDCTFTTATAFFSLMYVKGEDHIQVFKEAYRVLAPDGRFLIWDVLMPTRIRQEKDIAVFPLTVHLPDEEVVTGYGVPWPQQEHDLAYYVNLALRAGFQVLGQRQREQTFFLELHKPC